MPLHEILPSLRSVRTTASMMKIFMWLFISRSNFKNNPALCEQQLLLAANKGKEWGMFERWIIVLLLFHE